MRAVTILSLAALVMTVSAKAPHTTADMAAYSFQDFVRDFQRDYQPGTEEYELRRGLFEQRKRDAIAHNSDVALGRRYSKGINQFSDSTEAEKKARLGGKIHQKWDLRERLNNSPLASKFKAAGTAVPQSVDWRNRVPSIFTGVKNQGQCGSCWAHASTENVESHWALRTGQLFTLSQQQVTACSPNPDDCGGTDGCGGSIAELAYSYLAGAGVAEEWAYPYTAFYGTTGTCKAASIKKTDVNVTGFTKVAANDQSAVMEALAFTGPLAVNVDASHWFEYKGGIYDGCDFNKNITIDHVVQLVGYGYDDGLKEQYWIIRNSWSADWGENGYLRIIKHDAAECGWDVDPQDGTACKGSPDQLWVCGQCGVLFDTSFPTVSA